MFFFLINAFKGNTSYPSILDSVSLRISSGCNRDYSTTFCVCSDFNASPST
jgi:hypothetical protein